MGDRASKPPATPRWVKVAAIVVGVVIAVFFILLVTEGPHSPARHLPGGGGGSDVTTPEGHSPPPGDPGHD